MSVQSNIYILYGIIIPYPKGAETDDDKIYDLCDPYTDSARDEAVNLKDNITILLDGMGGKYTAIGHVTHKGDEYGGLDSTPVAITGDREEHRETIERVAKEIFGVDAPACGWHVICHYR